MAFVSRLANSEIAEHMRESPEASGLPHNATLPSRRAHQDDFPPSPATCGISQLFPQAVSPLSPAETKVRATIHPIDGESIPNYALLIPHLFGGRAVE